MPKKLLISKEKYQIAFEIDGGKLYISGGQFGELSVLKSPLFSARLKNVSSGEKAFVSSESFKNISLAEGENHISFTLSNPNGIHGITFNVNGEYTDEYILWTVDVKNENSDYSVMEATYPMPRLSSNYFDLFVPGTCGKVIKDAGTRGYKKREVYPRHRTTMQYYAAYGKVGGIYLGIEDPTGAVKRFNVLAESNELSLTAEFFGINASNAANSFALHGGSKWQVFDGDWYDAAMIYADFVYKKAEWLPEIDAGGRRDIAPRFKDVAFWISDYIPNSEYQGDNVPASAFGDYKNYPDDYWCEAAIRLKKELDVPVAYHVYNWHTIPFNVEYPHFDTPKAEFLCGLKKLQENGILVVPYINAVSWDTQDGEAGHEISFENTGKHGAVINENGEIVTVPYPQTTVREGKEVKLAPICPSFEKWHALIEGTIRNLENEVGVDGVYLDEVAAHPAYSCFNREHSHAPGGGSHWVENYNKMMSRINKNKPKDGYYYTECNAEPYMKSFDGFLSWIWVENGEVPAFPAIYSGYIQFVGRYTMGKQANDYNFFKYAIAKSLVCGQQIGWCRANVVDKPEWLDFLKKIVKLRSEYTELFNSAKMLRPPKVESELPTLFSDAGGLADNERVVMEQLIAGAWKYRSKEKTVIFLINTAECKTDFALEFSASEYGITENNLPSGFKIYDGKCLACGKIAAHECKIWEI